MKKDKELSSEEIKKIKELKQKAIRENETIKK